MKTVHIGPGITIEGFDWSRVRWAGAYEPPPDHCSYCDEPLPQDDDDFMPLMFWKEAGSCASFCDQCQKLIFSKVVVRRPQ